MKHVFMLPVMLVLLVSCSQHKYLSTTWEKPEYKQAEQIPATAYIYDNDERLFYLIGNDKLNLYVHLKSNNPTIQRQLMRTGLTVWIDTLAKKKKNVGLKFPVENMGSFKALPQLAKNSAKEAPYIEEMKEKYIEKLYDIELIGFSGEGSREMIPSHSKFASCSVNLNTKKDILYTFKVPFQSLGIDYASGKLLSISIESGALPEHRRPEGMSGRTGGGRPGGMGGGRSGMGGGRPGGMGGGRPGGKQGGSSQMSAREESNTQIKIQLKKVKLQ